MTRSLPRSHADRQPESRIENSMGAAKCSLASASPLRLACEHRKHGRKRPRENNGVGDRVDGRVA